MSKFDSMPDKSEIPASTNLVLAFAIGAAFVLTLTVMPYWLGGHVWAMLLITLLVVPLNTPLWSLIHEAIHRNFHPHRTVNEFAGRSLSILFGASFGVLRFGHLMHHQYNRDWENEYYSGSKLAAWIKHYFHMLGGLYITEVATSYLVALCPAPLTRKLARRLFSDDRHFEAVMNSLLKADNVKRIRTDCLWITFIYTCVFMIFGAAWIVPVVALLGRAVIISIMDNSYHYGTPQDGSVPAKELETSNFYSRFILNFNYHLTHHNHVALPWSRLAEKHKEEMTPFNEGLGTALAAQFKGPIKTD
ncbi:MAG: hypothetical protein DI586_01045 [Micavibrio aeruginosavorus]|uniref:Fatty acid desaturase domain-containing protein n=1 Tax=Micavibrio aeruginosavorus TaxID=349221 RepID=A0A2W5FQC5_9BACT|nr:MAG: hypothetical protein DI586_01045 [Micavibrio aeruginosavorus]